MGINTGPIVGGVIGKRKFQFDVWGDAVNIASRMQSSGVPNRIHMAKTTYELIRSRYECEELAPMEIKGKGAMITYLLKDDGSSAPSASSAGAQSVATSSSSSASSSSSGASCPVAPPSGDPHL